MYNKMLKETIRRNGDANAGAADVIRSLRSISNQKGFFRDLFKINGQLNKNNVKISFDRNGRPVLNGVEPFEAAQLRADLRQMPGAERFAGVPPANAGGRTSAGGAGLRPFRSSTASTDSMTPQSGLAAIAVTISARLLRNVRDPLRLVQFVWRYYSDNRDLIHDRLHIHFDQRFVEDVCQALGFIAQQAGQLLGQFVEQTAADAVWRRLNGLYESRWAEVTLRLAYESAGELYDALAAGLTAVRQYIGDGLGFRRTVERLLEELGSEVVRRLLRLSQTSFGTIVALGLRRFPAFERYFGEVLEVVTVMAQQAGVNDLSLYVLLMQRKEMEVLHGRATEFYERMEAMADGALRCTECGGSFAVRPLEES